MNMKSSRFLQNMQPILVVLILSSSVFICNTHSEETLPNSKDVKVELAAEDAQGQNTRQNGDENIASKILEVSADAQQKLSKQEKSSDTKNLDQDQKDVPVRPNIVIFIADDLGIGDVGCFGNDTIKTPNIDRIAREGAKLTHDLAAEALCTPSRSALLTGRYPIRSGMSARHRLRVFLYSSIIGGLPQNETTIGEAAKKMGYSTGFIGKWHLGLHCGMYDLFCHHPIKQGFDYYYGLPLTNLRDYGDQEKLGNVSSPYVNSILISLMLGGITVIFFIRKSGCCGKFLAYFLFFVIVFPAFYVYINLNNLKFLNSMLMRNLDVVEQPIDFGHVTQNLINEGVQFLEESKRGGRPFLLVVSWLQVHTVLHASERFRGKSLHGDYGDNVEEMDWSVGEIMKSLERLGYLENTLVYFTSDNGGHLEETSHGRVEGGWNGIYRGGKGQGGMDGGIRMPTVMMWKDHIAPGTIINHPTSHMDLLPTLMALWGQPTPTDRIIDGTNIYPLLSGRDTTPPHRFLMHYCGTDIHSARYTPDEGGDVYKLYYYIPNWLPGTYRCEFLCFCESPFSTKLSEPQLFNIGRDPSEKKPLPVSDPRNQKIIKLINEAVEAHKQGVQSVPNQLAIHRMIPLPWLQPCCNYPQCSCRDDRYD